MGISERCQKYFSMSQVLKFFIQKENINPDNPTINRTKKNVAIQHLPEAEFSHQTMRNSKMLEKFLLKRIIFIRKKFSEFCKCEKIPHFGDFSKTP